MLYLGRPDVVVGTQIVAVLEAVIIVVRYGRRAIEQPRDTVIGIVVRVLVEVIERPTGIRAKSERQRWRHTKAAILRDISSGNVTFIAHQIKSKRRALAKRGERPVDVERQPPGEIGAEIQVARNEARQSRSLGGLIHHPAGRAAAESDRGWPLQYLDLLRVERVSIVAAKVAHPIDEEIVASRESADRQVVPLGAALTRRQADAGDIAQRIAQSGDTLLLHHLLRDRVDGLRSVQRSFRVLR